MKKIVVPIMERKLLGVHLELWVALFMNLLWFLKCSFLHILYDFISFRFRCVWEHDQELTRKVISSLVFRYEHVYLIFVSEVPNVSYGSFPTGCGSQRLASLETNLFPSGMIRFYNEHRHMRLDTYNMSFRLDLHILNYGCAKDSA